MTNVISSSRTELMIKYAVIAAGGSGTRMDNDTPKQFLQLNGKPILWHSVKAFLDAFSDTKIIVVAPAGHLALVDEICAEFGEAVTIIPGGGSRFQSVKNGLQLVKEQSVVFVHDAVRCLVSKSLLNRCYEEAVISGSAIPSVAATDSMRIQKDGTHTVIDRNSIRIIQTPQTFRSEIILPAFEAEESDMFTDEATVVEAYGTAVHLVEGEYTNIKITRPLDLLLAERIMEERLLFK